MEGPSLEIPSEKCNHSTKLRGVGTEEFVVCYDEDEKEGSQYIPWQKDFYLERCFDLLQVERRGRMKRKARAPIRP